MACLAGDDPCILLRRGIALGSGVSVTQVNQLLKQFGQMRKMMRSKGKMSQMMKQFGGGKMPF